MMFHSYPMVEMTGHSRNQLREWCCVRWLVPPDIMADGPGSHATFTWQTALSLRILKNIQDERAGRVSTWAPVVRKFRAAIDGTSFPSLLGYVLEFKDYKSMSIQVMHGLNSGFAFLAVPLAPHLEALASNLAIEVPNQLPQFPPMAVRT